MAQVVDPEAEFYRHMPDMFLRDWVLDIEDCYRTARAVGSTHGLRQAQSSWNEPLFRRALIESRVQDVATRYPNIQVVQEWAGKQSSPYIVIKSGPIVLTESMVESRCQLPREAGHRRANAQGNHHLFSEYEDELPIDTPIYAILAHVPDANGSAPRFVDVIFPNVKYDGIIGRPIDLLAAFSGRTFAPPVAEEEINEPTPELKNKPKKKAD